MDKREPVRWSCIACDHSITDGIAVACIAQGAGDKLCPKCHSMMVAMQEITPGLYGPMAWPGAREVS